MSLASAPAPGHPVPQAMLDAAGAPVTLVWLNRAGGLTGRVESGQPRFIKWNPAGSGESLAAEAERLEWLRGRHPAPEVLDLIENDGSELLITQALPGRSAVDSVWLARPDDAVRTIAEGLRALHSLPTASCPFDWGVETRIAEVIATGADVPESLQQAPSIDKLVVCHGDACAPNTLIGNAGEFAAHVDLARLGLADRWADLAAATMSLGWNYATHNEDLFWSTYGCDPDRDRLNYYRDLWNA
ncbi:aminoglycoside 3'-phosphotransferase [Leucobacter viscericola]|uniref:Aminoglycoside 3'-phosphotransferase n=1 Tax=Leucobacter viscericola TaxID=2714935 RepID=A0A6G7XEB6_9MICO|nr:aminoglycoside 3'-phosphotransferase [Leucobacter viscericola]QIK62718.1 aminoglycoside 3'-phosphotransferase [Leucobacter viscericola]